MQGFKLAGVLVLLTIISALCEGSVTRSTELGRGTIKVHDGPHGKDTILDGRNGIKVLDRPKGKLTLLGSKVRRDTRAANAAVIEHVAPKEAKPHSNTLDKVRRESATEPLHRVPLTRGRSAREAKAENEPVKPPGATLNPATHEAEPTPGPLGNVITVPDNCPKGQKYVNGACREIW
ncbi:uncharacterized protein LOC125228122 [Leguminivora glycinivorella]|uniref:uncharacterized protein LOC125228122 n=1 Tax=Leguminivora glycinivorella TaxID=1035111 RepID=UPI00200D0F20|nr:uncharacterized protein LOC125228122 [Leguminivora glycinivorella]XP_047988537.1 uncharacterized protein LOC125228122 [Leguminivora glycinivorella]